MAARGSLSHGFCSAVPPKPLDARQLFINFIEDFLEVSFQGFQPGYGSVPDLLLFRGCSFSSEEPILKGHASALAVPVSVLLEPREKALEIVRAKMRQSQKG
jgi:hypothetical protein